MNLVGLVGHVSRPPTVRCEGEGTPTASFTVVVSEVSREGKPYTTFMGCVAWGKNAERCRTLHAEDMVVLVGKLTWVKRQHACGQDHSQLVVQVRELALVEAAAVEGGEG